MLLSDGTRTSVLFCKHGGLIVPLTLGQSIDINTGINGNNYFGIKGKEPAGSVTCKTKEEEIWFTVLAGKSCVGNTSRKKV